MICELVQALEAITLLPESGFGFLPLPESALAERGRHMPSHYGREGEYIGTRVAVLELRSWTTATAMEKAGRGLNKYHHLAGDQDGI